MNITQLIFQNARKFPYRKAIIAPLSYDKCDRIAYTHYTFEQFVHHSQVLSQRLSKLGVKAGTRTLLFVKPSIDFPLVVFSLFSLGAVPILIDPGVGRKNLLAAISKVQPEVLIAEPMVHYMRRFFPKAFASIRISITTQGPSFFTSRLSLQHMIIRDASQSPRSVYIDVDEHAPAAIVYTSGATGIPKGVIYTHRMFYHQVKLLKEILPRTGHDIDLSCFPLFSLFAIAMGMTSVIPWLDAGKPATADPQLLLRHIQDHGTTLASGSPAIWQRLADFCVEKKIQLPSLRGIMMFGAPIALQLHEKMQSILPNGTTYTPYGATESLPVSWISGRSILANFGERSRRGEGTCIGKVVPTTEARIIKTSFEVIAKYDEAKELAPNEVGELIVSGEQVTREYFAHREETLRSKINDGQRIWHRMGDLAYKDNEGFIWFCGRKVHQVVSDGQIFYSINCEAIFNQHPQVRRSALIAYQIADAIRPAIVLERKDRKAELPGQELTKFNSELLLLAKAHPHTRAIATFFLHQDFPVDCRHNIKIDRIYLGQFFSRKKKAKATHAREANEV